MSPAQLFPALDWQNATVAAAVILAAGFLTVRAWRSVFPREDAGCGGGCTTCPDAQGGRSESPQPTIIPIERLTSAPSRSDHA